VVLSFWFPDQNPVGQDAGRPFKDDHEIGKDMKLTVRKVEEEKKIV
jgi:hypothetical protein